MPIQRVCSSCGNKFLVSPSRIASERGKYCSIACRGIGKRAGQILRQCVYCGREFMASLTSNWKNQRYCSRGCVMRHNGSKRKMPLEKRLISKINFSIDERECAFWTGSKDKFGYGKTYKIVNGKRIDTHAPRAIYELYFGPLDQAIHVLHSCDNPACCNIYHLFIGNQQSNMADKISKGRQAKGEKVGSAKLTEREVMKIKYLIKQGVYLTNIAYRFDVTISTISQIKAGLTWKHVPWPR